MTLQLNREPFERIFAMPFIQKLEMQGGQVLAVGGCVRDAFTGKDPKDIDLLVRRIPAEQLQSTLQAFGKVQLVGESFGVFKLSIEAEEFDVALPRRDVKVIGETDRNKMIVAQSDFLLPLKDDQFRRDFTINSMALGTDFELHDPFGGLLDLELGIIRAVSHTAFLEDPLRMLRAIQFAARFNFVIDANTLMLIADNKHLIRAITPERVLEEFKKVFEKGGSIQTLGQLLDATGIFGEFFGCTMNKEFDSMMGVDFTDLSLAEFLHMSVKHFRPDTANFFKKKLKIDNKMFDDMRALDILFTQGVNFHSIFKAIQLSALPFKQKHEFIDPFLDGRFPTKLKELAIDGDALIDLGIPEGRKHGELQKKFLDAIFSGSVRNTREDLITLIDF